MRELLNHLRRRSIEDFEKFLLALKETGHTHIVEKYLQGITKNMLFVSYNTTKNIDLEKQKIK